MISACSHQPLVQDTQLIEPRVANPVVPVLDQWQPITSPVDATDDNADLWQRIIKSYGFNQDIDNPRVRSQLNWYKKHQAYMDRMATRAQRYMYYIAE